MEVFLAVTLAGVIYFLPTIVAASRHHHNGAAIFVLNLLPGALLVGQILYHQRVAQDSSIATLLAFALSGQAVVYQALPWLAAIAWLLTLVWSFTNVLPQRPSNAGIEAASAPTRSHASLGPVLIVLGLAVAGGLVGHILGKRAPTNPSTTWAVPPRVVTQEVPVSMAQVLVAKTDIGLGQIASAENFRWQDWPNSALSKNYIQRSARPNAVADLTGAVARTPLLPGEPITPMKLVKVGEGGVLAAILRAGMRAISTRIKEETGVGKLILPNDHVDVLLTTRRKNEHNSETLFRNVRVLAIGQLIEAKEGKKLAEGNTVTLELTPQQAERLALTNTQGEVSLVPRSTPANKLGPR